MHPCALNTPIIIFKTFIKINYWLQIWFLNTKKFVGCIHASDFQSFTLYTDAEEEVEETETDKIKNPNSDRKNAQILSNRKKLGTKIFLNFFFIFLKNLLESLLNLKNIQKFTKFDLDSLNLLIWVRFY